MDALVSIIIPTYNTKLYIDRCLQSIINQSNKNIEIIVIDDGSTDQTADYIINQYPTIAVYKQTNKGVSSARNYGIDVAKGEYVLFVDSDDWIDLNVVELLLEGIQKGKYDVAMIGHIRELMQSGTQVFKYAKNYGSQNIFHDLPSMMQERNEFMFASPCGRIYRNSILQSKQIRFNTSICYGEDRLFNMEYFSYAPHYVAVKDCYYHYTTQERQSSVATFSDKRLYDECYVLAKEQQWMRKFNILNNQKVISQFIISVIRSLLEALYSSNETAYFKKGHNILRTIRSSVDIPLETYEFKHKILFTCYRYNLIFIIYLYYRYKIFSEMKQ